MKFYNNVKVLIEAGASNKEIMDYTGKYKSEMHNEIESSSAQDFLETNVEPVYSVNFSESPTTGALLGIVHILSYVDFEEQAHLRTSMTCDVRNTEDIERLLAFVDHNNFIEVSYPEFLHLLQNVELCKDDLSFEDKDSNINTLLGIDNETNDYKAEYDKTDVFRDDDEFER